MSGSVAADSDPLAPLREGARPPLVPESRARPWGDQADSATPLEAKNFAFCSWFCQVQMTETNRRRERKIENLLAYKPENNGVSTQLCSVAIHAGSECLGGCWRQFLPVCLVSLLLSVLPGFSPCCFYSWSASPPRMTEVPPAMLDKSYSLCNSPGRVIAVPGVSPMAGALPRPCTGRGTSLMGQCGATCSPWGQKGGQSPPNTWAEQGGEAAPQRPWSDFYQQGGKQCWEGWHRVTVCGAGGTWCPSVTEKPQPHFLAVTTTIPCMNKAPGKKDNLELSHLKTGASVHPACPWHPVPTSRPSAARRASVPGAQRKETGPGTPLGPLPTPTGLVSSFLPGPGPHGAVSVTAVCDITSDDSRERPTHKLTPISLSGSHPS